MRVLCIGGSRFMGPLLLPRLLARGDRITTFRRGTDYGHRPLPGVEDLRGDRTDDTFDVALRDRTFDAVVDFAAYEAPDVERLARVLDGRIDQYLLVSTGQVYLVREGLARPYREQDYDGPTMPAPEGDDRGSWDYGMGKRACEDAARRLGLPFTTLRIPIVHGLGDPENRLLSYVERILDGGPILLPDGGRQAIRHVFADAVALTILALLGRGDAIGEAFNQTHDETPTLLEVVTRLGALLGRAPDVREVTAEQLVAAGLAPRDVSPLSSRWSSFLDPAKIRAFGVGHPPLDTMLAAVVHAYLSRGARLELPTRARELAI